MNIYHYQQCMPNLIIISILLLNPSYTKSSPQPTIFTLGELLDHSFHSLLSPVNMAPIRTKDDAPLEIPTASSGGQAGHRREADQT